MEQAIEATLRFQAVITPRRALSVATMQVLLGVISLLCVGSATLWAVVGAWPVGGFTGLELLLAAWLFRLHIRDGRARELVVLTDASLRVIRTSPTGRRQELTLEPSWLHVRLTERPGRTPALLVEGGRQSVEIAGALGDAEKRDLARALDEALYRWRNPRFDQAR